MVTDVPPAVEPVVRFRPVTRGARSTTSKSVALIDCTCSTEPMFHWLDGMPVKYMSEPLSATIIPYVFIAWAIALASGDHVLGMTKLDLSRKRSPIRGRSVPVRELAWCEAGK